MSNKNIILGFAIGVLVIFAGVSFFVLSRGSSDDKTQVSDSSSSSSLSSVQNNNNTQPSNSNSSESSTEVSDSTPGIFKTYAESDIGNGKDTILFFRASWCPSCSTLERSINQSLSDIPSDVQILMVDYDTAIDLREKYNVRIQHTLVQVDNQGEEIKKWTGSPNLEDVITRVV
jgi:thiol-disulfide isomerase/thioredoxin